MVCRGRNGLDILDRLLGQNKDRGDPQTLGSDDVPLTEEDVATPEEGEPDAELAKLRRLDRESRRNIEHHIAVGNDLDEKASEVFRFNALLIGVVASATSILLQWAGSELVVKDWVIFTLLGGLLLLLVSLIFAIAAYGVTKYAVGLRSEDILRGLDEAFERKELLDSIAFTQAQQAIANRKNVDRTATRLETSLALLVLGLLGLIISATGLLYHNYTV